MIKRRNQKKIHIKVLYYGKKNKYLFIFKIYFSYYDEFSIDKSFLSNLSRINKEEDLEDKANKDINLNTCNDFYDKNKLNKKILFNHNSLNENNKTNHNKSCFLNNKNSINNKFDNNIMNNKNNIQTKIDLKKNDKRIINQNCYQINIENMSIHTSINNINQNYKINTSNDNQINNKSNKNNISKEIKKEDYSNSNSTISYKDMNLKDLLNNIETISSNQSGCRFLQNKLQENISKANDFYKALELNNLLKKMTIDTFGNYLIQKLLEYITNDLVQEFFKNIICPSFMEICLNSHGSRVIQKILARIYKNKNLMQIFNENLKSSMLEIFLNQSSTHIIIKYISLIKYPNNQIIYKFIFENIFYIATHKHSCCTLQKCLEEGNETQKKEILMNLAKISDQLFSDQYGNYAIQFVLSLKDEEANKIIISKYLNDFQNNISNKISSNVYEKVLEFSDFNTKQYIIKSLCNFETVKRLLYDTYGNYILQKTVLISNEPYRSMYIKFIAPLIDGLKNMPNGLIIIHKILNNFPEIQNYIETYSYNNYNYYYNMNNNLNQNMNNGMNNNTNFINYFNNSDINNNFNIDNNYNHFNINQKNMMYKNYPSNNDFNDKNFQYKKVKKNNKH